MKKSIIFIALLAFTLSMYGQIVGVNFATAKKVITDDQIEYGKLVRIDDAYIIPFEQTPVGLKHCMEKMNTIMTDNDLSVDNTVNKDILMADYVDGLTDYSALCTSARVGSSEISISWVVNGYRVTLFIGPSAFGIFFTKE